MVGEVPDRQVAEQDLPPAYEIEEVVVGQSGERPAGVVEAEEPREGEDRQAGRAARAGPDSLARAQRLRSGAGSSEQGFTVIKRPVTR